MSGVAHLIDKLEAAFSGIDRFPLLLLVFAALFLTRTLAAPVWDRPVTTRLVRTVSGVLVAVGVIAAIVYLFLPQYVDHIEAHVTIVALNWLAGMPIHPDWTSADGAYGMLYGPLLYQIVAAPLLIFKSIAATKILPVLACLGSIAAMFAIGARSAQTDRRDLTLYYVLVFVAAGALSFWVRSEPFLVLSAALACLAAVALPPLAALGVVGLLAGLATGVKIHAFLYLAPLAGYVLLTRMTDWRTRMVSASVALAGFMIGLLAPFGFSLGHLMAFEKYVQVMARHGLSPRLLVFNVFAAAVITLPYISRILSPPSAADRLIQRGLQALTLLCVAAVALIGAKPGSGPHHLIPFVPVILLFCLEVPPPRAPSSILLLTASAAAALAPMIAVIQLLSGMAMTAGEARAQQAEAAQIAAANPGAEFGPGDDAMGQALKGRVSAALAGSRLRYDTSAWLDLSAAGVTPLQTQVLTDCAVKAWIVPNAGEPFSLISGYTNAPLFSPSFQASFKATHRLSQKGRYFSLWTCVQ